MLKKRTLLLGAALAAFGAMMVGAAFSFAPVTDVETSLPVDVADPVTPFLVLEQTAVVIPADNAFHPVADIKDHETDTNYSWVLNSLVITGIGAPSAGTCGAHDYDLSTGGNTYIGGPDLVPASALPVDTTIDLVLKIASAGTEATCQISGATVTATFQVP